MDLRRTSKGKLKTATKSFERLVGRELKERTVGDCLGKKSLGVGPLASNAIMRAY